MASQAQDDLRITDEFDFEVFWEKHGKQVTGVVIGIVALGLLVMYWQHQAAYQAEQAVERFAMATDAASLQAVARDFPKSPVAPEALARLAEVYYRNGRYSDAASTYQSIIRDYPGHPLGVSSKIGLAQALEAQGNIEGAKAEYMQIISGDPGSYIGKAARMGLARCMELQGQKKEARQLYEEILAGGQGTPWFEKAYLRMMVLNRDIQPEKATDQSATPLSTGTSGVLQLPTASTPK
ncbi:MAG TPA: tetratricopeptide repeat protein [Verrucomicrobiae bacterium]|nr:tetratricopeptide repeat protein [Verrucomicrobiae bacterium]